MKPTISNLILFVLLASCIAWINCGDDENPLAPSRLAGIYTFVSVTDKADNFTINAGDVADFDGPGPFPEGAITGTLELTETTVTYRFIVTPTEAAPIPITVSGTYTISGSTLTTVTLRTETFTISLSGNRLTLENDETKIVFDKQ